MEKVDSPPFLRFLVEPQCLRKLKMKRRKRSGERPPSESFRGGLEWLLHWSGWYRLDRQPIAVQTERRPDVEHSRYLGELLQQRNYPPNRLSRVAPSHRPD